MQAGDWSVSPFGKIPAVLSRAVLELLHGVRHAPVHILGVGPASMHDRAGNSFEINVLTEAGQAPTAGAKLLARA